MSTNNNFEHSIIFHNILNWIHKKSLAEQLVQLILPLFVQLAYIMKHSTPVKNIKTKTSCELVNRKINRSIEETHSTIQPHSLKQSTCLFDNLPCTN